MVPDHQEKVRLGCVLRSVSRPVSVLDSETYRLLGVRWYGNGCHEHSVHQGRELKTKQLNLVQANDVVYNKMWTTKAAFAVAEQAHHGLVATSEYPTFVADLERLFPPYLRAFMTTEFFLLQARDACQGSTSRARLNPSAFLDLSVRLPPLPEQKRIAAILSSVDEVIAKTEAVIAQLQIVKKAMMEQLLTKGMPGRHTRFKQTEIGEIPEEWDVVRAGELCEVITKGATPKVVTSTAPDCVPFLRVQNIGRRGEIDLSGSALFVTERTHTTELMRSQIRPGDVLMNIVGPPLGKVAVVPISIPKANINQAIALLRPARIESEYLSLCLTAEHLFAWLLKQAKRTSSQLNLTLESCREFPLPLPERSERREIIACTVAMQLILDAQQTELVALREVKSSLSSSLLSGELRVIPEVAE